MKMVSAYHLEGRSQSAFPSVLAYSPGNAPDGMPANLIFLILTSRQDNGAQLEILADIARTFHDGALREKTLRIDNHTEFLALIKTNRN